jgi:hypothetical protein
MRVDTIVVVCCLLAVGYDEHMMMMNLVDDLEAEHNALLFKKTRTCIFVVFCRMMLFRVMIEFGCCLLIVVNEYEKNALAMLLEALGFC